MKKILIFLRKVKSPPKTGEITPTKHKPPSPDTEAAPTKRQIQKKSLRNHEKKHPPIT